MPFKKKKIEFTIKVRKEVVKPSSFIINLKSDGDQSLEKSPKTASSGEFLQKKIQKKIEAFLDSTSKINTERLLKIHQKFFTSKIPSLARGYERFRWSLRPQTHLAKLKKKTYKQSSTINWQTSLSGMFIFLLLIILTLLPVKAAQTYYQVKETKKNLTDQAASFNNSFYRVAEALEQGDFNKAREELVVFEKHLQQARETFKNLGLVRFLPQASSINTLLGLSAKTTLEAVGILGEFQKIEKDQKNLNENLRQIHENFANILKNLEKGEKLTRKFNPLHRLLSSWRQEAEQISKILSLLPDILGAKESKTYLILFQNNHEIRPTGGFIGSFAIIKIFQGQIQALEIPSGGSYDLQGSLTEKLISPRPLWLINPRFEFQDLNWFPDFPTSARKITDIYEKTDGQTIDGVFAINASFVKNLIGLLGPVEMPVYQKTINEKNFFEEIQRTVKVEYDKQDNQPKKIIGDLFNAVFERLGKLEKPKIISTLALVFDNLVKKDIQIYLNKPDQEQIIKELGWAGEIKNTDGDYLMTIASNIAGGKTDGAIKQKIRKEVFVLDNDELISRVIIERTHTGQKGEPWTGQRNVTFLRIYTPEGSEFLGASGFTPVPLYLFEKPEDDYAPDPDVWQIERTTQIAPDGTMIAQEAGKTIFGNWLLLDPGETKEVILTYKLPSKIKIDGNLYTLMVQKQSSRSDLLELAFGGKTFRLVNEKNQTDNQFELDNDKLFAFITN